MEKIYFTGSLEDFESWTMGHLSIEKKWKNNKGLGKEWQRMMRWEDASRKYAWSLLDKYIISRDTDRNAVIASFWCNWNKTKSTNVITRIAQALTISKYQRDSGLFHRFSSTRNSRRKLVLFILNDGHSDSFRFETATCGPSKVHRGSCCHHRMHIELSFYLISCVWAPPEYNGHWPERVPPLNDLHKKISDICWRWVFLMQMKSFEMLAQAHNKEISLKLIPRRLWAKLTCIMLLNVILIFEYANGYLYVFAE